MPITKILFKTIKFKQKEISYGSKRFKVSIADSFGKKALGLMHRDSMQDDEGMLFIFNKDGKYDIWMPNMKFSIDIVWLDSESKVLKIVEGAEPCDSVFACPAYLSPDNARYILEFNAGTVKREKIKEGRSFILYHIKDFHGK